jgi:hypothetical protein
MCRGGALLAAVVAVGGVGCAFDPSGVGGEVGIQGPDAAWLVQPSCRDLGLSYPTAQSGVYTLDAGTGPFRAYCELEEDGGGWTLALKVNGVETTFAYDAGIWEDQALLSPGEPGLDRVEAKLETWNAVPFAELRLGLEHPIESGDVRWLVIPLAADSLHELFSSGEHRPTSVGREAWKGLLEGSSLQLHCNREGSNNYHQQTRVRLGILGNQEDDCGSPDSRLGIGGAGTICGSPTPSVGNTACFEPDNGDVSFAAFGWLLVR